MDNACRGGHEHPEGSRPLAPQGDPPLQGKACEPKALCRDDKTLALRARDRVLLYTRGMGLDPLPGVELALESLRRAVGDEERGSPVLDVAGAMQALRAILEEHGISPEVEAPDGGRLVSSPPLNRSRMVPGPDTWSLRARIRRRFRRDKA